MNDKNIIAKKVALEIMGVCDNCNQFGCYDSKNEEFYCPVCNWKL
jgi:hypothetical protein